MKVTVIGPGAMGCLFAARLANSGAQTTLLDHRPDRAARLKEKGIVVESETGELVAHPEVVSRVSSKQDLVIVLVKSFSLSNLHLPTDTPVLTLQNGLGNAETLCAQVGSANLLAGVTSEAATLVGEGRTRYVASGLTRFGAWTSCPTKPALDTLTQAGFNVEVTDAPGQIIWEKVAMNAAINPLTALLNVPNGRLLEIPEARQLMRDLVVEAVKVASTEGYRFECSLVEEAEAICRATRANISSMLQDVRGNKNTEVDAISGEILRRAQLAALPTHRGLV